MVLRALITERQARGAVFVPMHWNDQFASNARIDRLVAPLTDPHSGQPALKNVAVSLRRHDAAYFGFAVSCAKPDPRGAIYWAIARTEGGWRTELALESEPADWAEWCRESFVIAGDIQPLGYADRETGDRRLAFFDGEMLVAAVFLGRSPVAVSRGWAAAQLTVPHGDVRRRFAIAAGRPGADQPDKGAIVCSCFSVGSNEIAAAGRNGCRTVEAIGEALKAGTNCGSCRAEIRGILHGLHVAAAE